MTDGNRLKDYPSKIWVLVDKDGIPIARPRLNKPQAEAARKEMGEIVADILEYDLTIDVSIFDGAESLF
jgi:hypothetical protein